MGMIPQSEFSEPFVQGMRERMAVSYYKYGAIKDGFPHKVNALESLRMRIDKYHDTGNTEFLIDVANFAMIEFMLPGHPRAHFKSTDSNESPGRATFDNDFKPDDRANDQLTDGQW